MELPLPRANSLPPWPPPSSSPPEGGGETSVPQSRAVVALVGDLFFASRIAETLKRIGCPGAIDGRADLFQKTVRSQLPALVLIDMGIRGVDWAETVRGLRADPALAPVPIVAFGPHRDLEARELALAAGCTEVVANSKLVGDLPGIIRKYLRGDR